MSGAKRISLHVFMMVAACAGLLAALVPATPALAVDGVWQRAADIPGQRVDGTSHSLPDGRVMVIGGVYGSLDRGAWTVIYDPGTGQWSSSDFVGERVIEDSVMLSDGRVIALAHCYDECDADPTLSIFDPSTSMWALGAQPRDAHARLAALQNDRVLAISWGGRADVYDPVRDRWTPVTNAPTERPDHLVTLKNGKVLTIAIDRTCHLYNPVTNMFTPTGTMQDVRYETAITMLNNGKVLVVGGYSAPTTADMVHYSSTELYDPETGVWSYGPAMPSARANHSAVKLLDGSVLVFGGRVAERPDDGWSARYVHTTIRLDPVSNQWAPNGDMLFARTGHTATLMRDGRVIVSSGGVYNDPDPAADESVVVEIYSPVPDVTPPNISRPTISFAEYFGLYDGIVPAELSWSAIDDGGIARFELQVKQGVAAYVSTPMTWEFDDDSDDPFARVANIAVTLGDMYRVRMRAVDHTGNRSVWRYSDPFRVFAEQESSSNITYRGPWYAASPKDVLDGEVRHTAAAGRRATFHFTGTSVAWVSMLGRNRGIAEVWLDGERYGTVDLANSYTKAQQVVWDRTDLAPGLHTLEIRVTGQKHPDSAGSRVDIDAFIVLGSDVGS